MKKVLLAAMLLFCLSSLGAASLFSDDEGPGLSYSGSFLSFNTRTDYFRLRYRMIALGALADIWNAAAVFDTYAFSWKNHWKGEGRSFSGAALSFDQAAFFWASEPFYGPGVSINLYGLQMSVAYVGRRKTKDHLLMNHWERAQPHSLLLRLTYSNEYFLLGGKLSHSSQTGSDFLIQAGLSYKGLSLIYTRGSEANVYDVSRRVQRAFYIALDSQRLSFRFSLEYLNDPVRAGDFRQIEAWHEAAFEFWDRIKLTAGQKSISDSTGGWKTSRAVKLEVRNVTIGLEDGEYEISIALSPVTVSIGSEGFSFAYAVSQDRFSLSIKLYSSGRIDSSFSFEFA